MAQQRGSYVPVVIGTETTFKTPPTSGGKLYYVSESLRLSRNLLSSRTLRGTRQALAPVRGNLDVAGDITFELSSEQGLIMKHIFGGLSTTGSNPYTHVFSVGDLPAGMSVEKQFTDLATAKFFLYSGCKVNTFRARVVPEGFIECTASLIGAKEAVANYTQFSSVQDRGHSPWDGFAGSISVNGVNVGIVTAFDFTLENGIDGNTYVIDGTGERYSMPEGQAKVTGTLTTLFTNTDLYQFAINYTECSIGLVFTRGTGVGSSGNEKLSFLFDEVYFKPQAPVVQGPTGMLVEIPFEAFYGNDSDANMFRAELKNTVATWP